MTKADLLKYVDEDWKDYRNKYLVPYWKDKAGSGKWQELVTDNFKARHTVDGTVSQEQALKVCKQRSANGTHDFNSTIVTEALMKSVVKLISDSKIAQHTKAFTNYKIGASGYLFDVSAKANKGYLVRVCKGSVEVGVDATGIINHLHGVSFDDFASK